MGIGRKFLTFAVVVGVTVIGGGFATAADNDSHDITYTIAATRSLSLSNSTTVSLGTVSAGSTTNSINGGNLQFQTDATGDKIVAKYTASVADATLKVTAGTVSCENPCTATAAGTPTSQVTLTGSDQNVIGTISVVGGGNATSALTYVLVADSVPGTDKTFTVAYTIKA